MRFLFLFVIMMGGALRVSAFQQQYPALITNKDFARDARQAIDSVYNMNSKASEKILAPWQQKYPKEPIWSFWNGVETWWEILPDIDNTALDKQMFYQFSQTDYECSQILSKDPDNLDALIIKSASNGYMARLYGNRSQWISALQKARIAKNALDRVREINPDLPDIKFGLGLYEYYVAWLPKAYPVLKSVMWLLPDGSEEKGIEMLHEAVENSIFVQPEALYMLGRIYYEGEHNTGEAIKYFQQLVNRYPENGYYKRIVVHLLYEEEDYNEAMKLIDRYLDESKQHPAPFDYALKENLYATKGHILFLYGNLDAAAAAFEQSRTVSIASPMGKDREFYLMDGYYLGEIYIKKNEKSKAEEYLREVSRSKVDSKYVEMARKALDDMK